MSISLKTDGAERVAAIDVHAHVGLYRKGRPGFVEDCMSASADEVVARAKSANTEITIISHIQAILPPGKADVIKANRDVSKIAERKKTLLFWVVLNPLNPSSFSQTQDLLGHPKCAGIKIHPEMHHYPIRRYGRKIFEFAAARKAIVLTHSGEPRSLPDEFVPFADAHPEMTLILGHLGCSSDDDQTHQVRAIEASKHGNIYVDTSSSMNILPRLIEWAVNRIGPQYILYGTDSPLYFAPMQRARINYADITVKAKRMILRENAAKIFGLGR